MEPVVVSWHPLDKDDPQPPEPDNSDVSTDDIYAMLGGAMLPRDVAYRREREENAARAKAIMSNPRPTLEAISTRELLDMHRRGIAGGLIYIPGAGEVGYSTALEKLMREILATRPHIPNKAEAKVMRRTKAQSHHGRGKAKNR